MTGQELLTFLGNDPAKIGAVIAAPPIAAVVVGFTHKRETGGKPPWRWIYMVLVYATCIPGMVAAFLTLYALLFTHQNLLDVNALLYFAPILSAGFTLFWMNRNVDFDQVPGFDRLWGLLVTMGLTFGILFVLSRTYFGVLFFGNVVQLVAIGAFVFALLKYGTKLMFRRRSDPRPTPPSI